MMQRKTLENRMKELILRTENAENALAKGGKKHVERLEAKVRELEDTLEVEKLHSKDALKASRQSERNCKDLEYQCQEEKRNYEKLEVTYFQYV